MHDGEAYWILCPGYTLSNISGTSRIRCYGKELYGIIRVQTLQTRIENVNGWRNLINVSLVLVIRDSQVLAKLVVVTIFFIGWGQTARLQRVRQNTADRIQTETEQQQTARLQRVRQNTADRILKFDKRYKAFEIAGYFQKHREIIG